MRQNVYPVCLNLPKDKETLILTPLLFFTEEDEDSFFAWLDKLVCLESYKGSGKELHVYLKSKDISYTDHSNLLGLFARYNLMHPEQLQKLNVIDWTDSVNMHLEWPLAYEKSGSEWTLVSKKSEN